MNFSTSICVETHISERTCHMIYLFIYLVFSAWTVFNGPLFDLYFTFELPLPLTDVSNIV